MDNYKINMEQYTKFLLFPHINQTDFEHELDQYSKILMTKKEPHTFKYLEITSPSNTKQNIIVKCSDNLSFYHFHNLILWFTNHSCIGLMLNGIDPETSYYCLPDKNIPAGDTLIGRFNNGDYLSIDVPKTAKESGNTQKIMDLSHDIPLLSNIVDYDENHFNSFDAYESNIISILL